MTRTREERLKAFNEGRKREKEEQEKREKQKNFTRDYDKLEYTALKDNEYALVRFIGAELAPNDPMRESTGWKEILRSYIVNDEGGGFFCNWSHDKSWILWKIYNKVMEYDWDDSKPDGEQKIFRNVTKFPALFQKIRYNDKPKENRMKWEKGWQPFKHLVSNIIDRLDYQWHVENKKFKLISKKANVKEDNTFYEPGLPPSIYHDQLSPEIIEKYGFLEDYDVGIKKIRTKDGKVTYKVEHSKKLDETDVDINLISTDLLTEEELTWEKYNIDKYFRVTSYQKIKKNLGIFIELVDKQMGTSFSSELNKLVEEEKIKFDEVYGNNEEYEVELPKETTNVTEIKVEEKTDENVELTFDYDKIAPFYKDLTDYEKKLVRGVNGDKVLFVKECGLESSFPECPNEKCKKKQPNELDSFCIFCGDKFK